MIHTSSSYSSLHCVASLLSTTAPAGTIFHRPGHSPHKIWWVRVRATQREAPSRPVCLKTTTTTTTTSEKPRLNSSTPARITPLDWPFYVVHATSWAVRGPQSYGPDVIMQKWSVVNPSSTEATRKWSVIHPLHREKIEPHFASRVQPHSAWQTRCKDVYDDKPNSN